jgi:hypothetical protein
MDGWIVPFPTDDKSRAPQLWRSFWADTPECFAALRAVARKAAAPVRPPWLGLRPHMYGMPAGDAAAAWAEAGRLNRPSNKKPSVLSGISYQFLFLEIQDC